MARQVRVASRALRRGRRLRARSSEVPPPATSFEASAGDETEPDEEPAVPTPDTRRLDESGDTKREEKRARDRYSRPAAPNLALFEEDEDEDEDAAEPSADDAQSLAGDPPDDAGSDDTEQGAKSDAIPAPRISAYSRPPAPSLDFGASDDEPESAPDPNATTLISREGPRPSRPSQSPVSVVDAADEDVPSDGDADHELGFVPEVDEPPISAQASSADGETEGKFFRQSEATLAPVVDELGPLSEGPLEPTLLSPAEASRRRTLRRVVGLGVIAAGLVTLALVATSAFTSDEQPASGQRGAPAAEAATEAKPAPEPPKAEPKAAAPTAIPTAEIGQELPDDYDEVEKQTLALLNDRKFAEAIPYAEKLIQLKPESAFGYRCLGSALQDLGRQAEAQKVYSDCATNATKGEVLECTALGGHNKNLLKK